MSGYIRNLYLYLCAVCELIDISLKSLSTRAISEAGILHLEQVEKENQGAGLDGK